MKVLILGATGMLGDAVLTAFDGFAGEVFYSSRQALERNSSSNRNRLFDVLTDDFDKVVGDFGSGDYIINCIGIIKTEIDELSEVSRQRAVIINQEFPVKLAKFAEGHGVKVIQIATDCVFSGLAGHYSESSEHDPVDLYGQTKSNGEVLSSAMMHLRVSIIGPEKRGFSSLYDWVARQPAHASIRGFTNHFWNGIPAKHFGKIARGIIENGLFHPGVQHIVPDDELTKCELVKLIAKHSGRDDLQISDTPASEMIDRTLSTNNQEFNKILWNAAGYSKPPTIAQLVTEI